MLLDTLDMIGETPTDARSMYSSYAVDVGHETMYGKDRQQVEGWCAKVQAAAAGAAAAGASGGIARQYGEHELMNIFAMKEIFINQMAAHPLYVVGGGGDGGNGSGSLACSFTLDNVTRRACCCRQGVIRAQHAPVASDPLASADWIWLAATDWFVAGEASQ